MLSWRNKIIGLALLFAASVPGVALADSCMCFCGTPTGAVETATQASATACADYCESAGDVIVGCYEEEGDYPQYNDQCWTEQECETWSASTAQGVRYGDWGDEQPLSCVSGMHYCYPDFETEKDAAVSPEITLGVAIGSTTAVGNIGEYIAIAYAWVIPAASIIAVVMLMLGGLQYALARGKSKYIEAAKTRMTNAVTGIVLLLSVYVILNLIDPRLVLLQGLRTPMIKEVTLLDANSTCNALVRAGFKVDPIQEGKFMCGNEGEIKELPSEGANTNVSAASWKVGDTCVFNTCADNKSCVQQSGEWTCVTCAEYPNPTASSCSAVEQKGIAANDDTYVYCNYEDEINSCVSLTSSEGSQGFTCDAVYKYAVRENKGCEAYLDYLMTAFRLQATGDIVYPDGDWVVGSGGGYQELCEADPCGLGDLSGGTCEFSTYDSTQSEAFSAFLAEYGLISEEGAMKARCETGI